jgi:hypothetical protein
MPAAAGSIGLVVAYFCWYAGGGLFAHFSPDDMMNMHVHWSAGWEASLRAILFFWTPSRRPLGALYYLPVYDAFHLQVLPYRAAILCLTMRCS